MDEGFADRTDLSEFEWDEKKKNWVRPPLDRTLLKELTRRSTLNGVFRVLYFMTLLAAAAIAAVFLARFSLWLALPAVYVYYFLYGFWVAIAHELQHKIVFGPGADWLSEIYFFFVQTLMWNSPTYARVSHRLHHRYTMIRGNDPENPWPEQLTTRWLRRFLLRLLSRILVIGAVVELVRSAWLQITRTAGLKDWMMEAHCTDQENGAIRVESLFILLIHLAIAVCAVVLGVWELLIFVTIAWQIGMAFETIWHATEHVGRPVNVKDHRLNTRSVRVGPFIRTIFGGLDDHVDHHLYPGVPSRNLRRLHKILEDYVPEPKNVFGCWAEIFEIARRKEADPQTEFVATGLKA